MNLIAEPSIPAVIRIGDYRITVAEDRDGWLVMLIRYALDVPPEQQGGLVRQTSACSSPDALALALSNAIHAARMLMRQGGDA
jgi:hypothetical protein